MRGFPGSGKSFTAKELAASIGAVIYSTDEFFVKNGVYKFVRKMLSDAHQWNRLRFQKAVENLVPSIIIDNTNVYIDEIKNYSDYAYYQGYDIHLVEPTSDWWKEHRNLLFSKKANKKALKAFALLLAGKTSHGVQPWSIERMIWKWQETSVDQLVQGL